MRGGWEPKECAEDLWEKGKEATRESSEGLLAGLGSDGFTSSICILVLSLKIVCHSLAFSHAEDRCFILYKEAWREERKQTAKCHPVYTWNGEKTTTTNGAAKKVFKELYQKNLFSYLSQNSMENNILVFKLYSLCWG